jgi:hypothetical protein
MASVPLVIELAIVRVLRLERFIEAGCKNFDVTDVSLTRYATAAHGYLNLATVVEISFLFVAIEDGKSVLINTGKQNSVHRSLWIRNNIRITELGGETLEPGQFSFMSGERTISERPQDTLVHQSTVNKKIYLASHCRSGIVANHTERQRGRSD